jgi:hypothetical protein
MECSALPRAACVSNGPPVTLHRAFVLLSNGAEEVVALERGLATAAQRAIEIDWQDAAERLTRVIARYGERGGWHAVDLTSAQAADNPRRQANV